MEKNVLLPKGQVESFFDNHIKKLMEIYDINNYLLLTELKKSQFLIRGSPQKLSALLIKELEGNTKLRNVIVEFLRSPGISKLFESEVEKNE